MIMSPNENTYCKFNLTQFQYSKGQFTQLNNYQLFGHNLEFKNSVRNLGEFLSTNIRLLLSTFDRVKATEFSGEGIFQEGYKAAESDRTTIYQLVTL